MFVFEPRSFLVLITCRFSILHFVKMSLNTFECFVPKYKRNGDIRFLRYLYLINAFCGFMPFYDFEERRLKSGLFYKIHPIFTVIIRIAFATFLIIELQKMDVYSEMIQRTLFYLENTAILCVSIIPTVQLTIFKRKSLRDLFGNFHKTDDVIANLKETSAITTDNGFFDSFLIEIVVFQLIFSALLIANFCLKPMNMSTTYTFSIIGAILLIMNQLFLYLMCNIALALRSRFQHLNDMILNLTKCDLTTMTLKSMQVHGFFTTLLETVYMYNDIFGWSILLFVAAMFVGFLNCFANLMTINEIDHMALENFAAIVILLVIKLFNKTNHS